uniref:Uncharacterized protein n=1 Tax=Panagrolaimus sp. ES5 TaxID=591445 RepID=A0AC34FIP6_9BILA
MTDDGEYVSLKARYYNNLSDYEELKLNLPGINEKWFLARGLLSFTITHTDVFQLPKSWKIFGDNIGKLRQLNVLKLEYCRISESLPENIYEALPTSITYFSLQGNKLTKISSLISRLENLQELRVDENFDLSHTGIPWDDMPKSLRIFGNEETKITEIPSLTEKHRIFTPLQFNVKILMVSFGRVGILLK